MLRFGDCVCGTSTTGTGTLTLAATPAAIGGIDPDVWARAAGIGFVNSAAFLIDYTLIEYTDNTFATEKSKEAGTGTLTLGGSSGIANCTLARTTIDWTATSLNSQPATVNMNPAGGITIGIAANTLVMVAPRSESLIQADRYWDTGAGAPPGAMYVGGTPSTLNVPNGTIVYVPYLNIIARFVTKACVQVAATYTGQNNNIYAALYDIGSNGRPSKLIADFGVLGTANSSFASGTAILSGALSNAIKLEPRPYIIALQAIWTVGGTGTPGINAFNSTLPPIFGMTTTRAVSYATATGGSAAFSDPATTTSWSLVSSSSFSSIPWVGFQ